MKFPEKFPEIRVSKYLLRKAKKEDAPYFFKYLTDPEVIKHTSYDVKSVTDIENWFSDYEVMFSKKQRISWIIEDTTTNTPIGDINFFDIQVNHQKGEIGYFLYKEYWGQGVMSEILSTILEYLFNTVQTHRIQAIVIEENIGSRRLLEKNGFTVEGVLKDYKNCRGKYYDFIIQSKIASK
jgi:ribosomal-protein-alanine N-acetyltransferase